MTSRSIAAPPRESSPATAQVAMVEALVGGEGLERVAEIAAAHVDSPVGIFVPRPGTEGDEGGAAERYVAELVAGGDPARPEEAREVVPIFCGGELRGAVVMLADGAGEADEAEGAYGADGAGEYLRVAALAALTGIAMMNARDETARSLSASFLGELMARRDARVDDVLRRAGLLGRDLSDGLLALCAKTRGRPPGALLPTIEAIYPLAFAEVVGGRVFALLPGRPNAAETLAARLAEEATVAVSSHYEEAGDARTALREAELLLEVGEGAPPHAFRLLFRLAEHEPSQLQRLCEETIGPVLRHDSRHASELMSTLRAYIAHDGNTNLTARSTYTHRHTVSNRLARIRELSGLDPVAGEDRELLSLALKARRVTELRQGQMQ